jgi:hypothetical protein
MATVHRLVLLALALGLAPACLVVTVNPTHERDELVWEPALIGTWESAEDKSSVVVDKGEWQSYRLQYTHPIETGQLTGYLTRIGKSQFLDVMPARGEDRGSFLVPVHVTLRVKLDGDRLEITPLSYDWFFDHLKTKAAVPGLNVALDEKENALIVSPTSVVRAWIARQPVDGKVFGAAATFTRKPGA